MKQKYIFTALALVFSLFVSDISYSQTYVGDLTLTTQAEVDSFNYTVVEGALTISGFADIKNLDGLSELRRTGFLNILNNDSIKNFNGLANLDTVDAMFIIWNKSLEDITFPSLSTAGIISKVGIYQNESLKNISFPVITELFGLEILNNPILTSVNFPLLPYMYDNLLLADNPLLNSANFQSLTQIDAGLLIGNSALKNLDGFNHLTSLSSHYELLGNGLFIIGNPKLKNINGLSNLTFVTNIYIRDNPLLTDINALQNISVLGDYWEFTADINIINNCALSNLDGFANLRSVTGNVNIEHNVMLKNIDGLGLLFEISGNLTIKGNTSLENIDGLLSLLYLGTTSANGVEGSDLLIEKNNALTNLNGLSNLGRTRTIKVLDNASLTEFCGLHFILSGVQDSWHGVEITPITISGNAANSSEAAILANGACETTISPSTDVTEKDNLPEEFNLAQNYPNPFNPSTQIKFAVPEESLVTMEIFNSIGEKVITLLNEVKSPGNYSINFDAGSLSSGLYLCRFRTGVYDHTIKMILEK